MAKDFDNSALAKSFGRLIEDAEFSLSKAGWDGHQCPRGMDITETEFTRVITSTRNLLRAACGTESDAYRNFEHVRLNSRFREVIYGESNESGGEHKVMIKAGIVAQVLGIVHAIRNDLKEGYLTPRPEVVRMEAREKSTTAAFCNECNRETTHRILAADNFAIPQDPDDPEYGLIDKYAYEILACCGCHTRLFRCTEIADYPALPEWAATTITQYPPPRRRLRPQWLDSLPNALQKLLMPTYDVYDSHGGYLVAFGIRTVIDVLMTEMVGDIGGFERKLDVLNKREFINKEDRKVLSILIGVGDAAAHRGHDPSRAQLAPCLDILENWLYVKYVRPTVAENIELKTPKRNQDGLN